MHEAKFERTVHGNDKQQFQRLIDEVKNLRNSRIRRRHFTRSRMPGNATTFRANGRFDGIRTYSRIPLHLRKDVPIRTQQNKRIENRNKSHTDNSRRVTINSSPIQTRVGRQIHTLARFVQLAYAVIAPNDIYCGPSAHII